MPVFVSHASADQETLGEFRKLLDVAGVAWWDPGTMEQGTPLRDQLRRAIEECPVCVFLATRRAIASEWCRAELGAFWGAGKPVIMLVRDLELTEEELPPQYRGDLWTRDPTAAVGAIRKALVRAEAERPRADRDTKRAVCQLFIVDAPAGTGYLVAPDVIATADFVVSGVSSLRARFFSGFETDAEPLYAEPLLGTALLRLGQSVPDVAPLVPYFGATVGTRCNGLGFPAVTGGMALPFTCEITDPEHLDLQRSAPGTSLVGAPRVMMTRLWTVVQSIVFATGSMEGLIGSPVWREGRLVGHIYRFMPSPQAPQSASYGIVFATPATSVIRALSVAGLKP